MLCIRGTLVTKSSLPMVAFCCLYGNHFTGREKKQAFTPQKIEGFSLFAPKRAHHCPSKRERVRAMEARSNRYVLENVAPPSLEWSF
jgi:hypothetical protein